MADVALADGRTPHLRPIRDDDGPRLVAFHSRLSPQTRYFRFFSPHPVLSPAEVEHFTHVDFDDRVAIVAELDGELVAVARYEREPGTDEAEAAFVVDDAFQGRGLGTLLLERLITVARTRGIRRFCADTLSGNRRMLSVFHAAGFPVEHTLEGGVVHVTFCIDAPVP